MIVKLYVCRALSLKNVPPATSLSVVVAGMAICPLAGTRAPLLQLAPPLVAGVPDPKR